MDAAAAGPETRCREEPQSAARNEDIGIYLAGMGAPMASLPVIACP
jgi:hypothetical protein